MLALYKIIDEKIQKSGLPIFQSRFGVHAISYATGKPYEGVNNFLLDSGVYISEDNSAIKFKKIGKEARECYIYNPGNKKIMRVYNVADVDIPAKSFTYDNFTFDWLRRLEHAIYDGNTILPAVYDASQETDFKVISKVHEVILTYMRTALELEQYEIEQIHSTVGNFLNGNFLGYDKDYLDYTLMYFIIRAYILSFSGLDNYRFTGNLGENLNYLYKRHLYEFKDSTGLDYILTIAHKIVRQLTDLVPIPEIETRLVKSLQNNLSLTVEEQEFKKALMMLISEVETRLGRDGKGTSTSTSDMVIDHILKSSDNYLNVLRMINGEENEHNLSLMRQLLEHTNSDIEYFALKRLDDNLLEIKKGRTIPRASITQLVSFISQHPVGKGAELDVFFKNCFTFQIIIYDANEVNSELHAQFKDSMEGNKLIYKRDNTVDKITITVDGYTGY